MEALWAPWRMEFILAPKSEGCLFCHLAQEGDDRERFVLWRGDAVYCVMNRYPYNPGHLMIVPHHHTDDLTEITPTAQNELMWAWGEATEIVRQTLRAEGMNCGMNVGKASGAGIMGHLHLHIVPRWTGDMNFLPVLGGTKSMPEYLDETYDRLAPAFAELRKGD